MTCCYRPSKCPAS